MSGSPEQDQDSERVEVAVDTYVIVVGKLTVYQVGCREGDHLVSSPNQRQSKSNYAGSIGHFVTCEGWWLVKALG